MQTPSQTLWKSRRGFLLAAMGSAVGLGNIWRFPYVAGENGGGAFILVYLGAVAMLGLPLVIAELAIGRSQRSDPVSAFATLEPRGRFRWVGWIGIAACIGILSYYPVITGWVANYLARTLALALPWNEADAISLDFSAIAAHPGQALLWYGIAIAVATAVVAAGVRNGIEKISKALMPLFLLLALGLAAWGLGNDGAAGALAFIFRPDWRFLALPSTYLAAIGQAFFSLGVAMAVLITYGGYMARDQRLPRAALTIVAGDTAIAMLGGLILFPAVFALGFDPAEGAALAFVVLPQMFAAMPAGIGLGIGFYLLLLIAALTSIIALIEALVAVAVGRWRIARKPAALAVGLAVFMIGLPATLGYGLLSRGDPGTATWLDLADGLTSQILLPLNGIVLALMVGWVWSRARSEEAAELRDAPWRHGWIWSLRIGIPLSILAAMAKAFDLL